MSITLCVCVYMYVCAQTPYIMLLSSVVHYTISLTARAEVGGGWALAKFIFSLSLLE
jgi:hypothetical protein